MWRSIFMNFRPVAVWAIDLQLFYGVTAGRFGEAWTAWSWLQLAGMAVLLLGTAVYNGSLRVLPGLAPAARAGGADAPRAAAAAVLAARLAWRRGRRVGHGGALAEAGAARKRATARRRRPRTRGLREPPQHPRAGAARPVWLELIPAHRRAAHSDEVVSRGSQTERAPGAGR